MIHSLLIIGYLQLLISYLFMKLYSVVVFIVLVALMHSLTSQPSFDPYDLKLSKYFVQFSSLAYCPNVCVEAWSCGSSKGINFTDITWIEYNLTKAGGFVGYIPERNQIVAAYRGSSNIQNWIQNANFEKVPYPFCLRCEIHTGFMADYALIESAVNNKISDLIKKYPGASVVTTGHSLGGALAMISALELRRTFANLKVEVHSYGAPRIGNVHLARHVNNKIQNIYRVVHNRDIVPHLPPDLPEFEYHHSAYEIFFNQEMDTYKTCSSTGEDRSCSNGFFPDYSTADHSFYFLQVSSPIC